jgi:lipopolysaccharide transport system permease protein
MTKFSASPHLVFVSLWRNRSLVWQLTKRDVIGRYRGSVMGLLWSFFNPILMLVVYTFVFGVVFRARWGLGDDASTAKFAVVLFSGLVTYNLFSECVNRAPRLVLENVNYVKKVVFPLEIMPWIAMGATLFHAGISVGVLIGFGAVVLGTVPWTVVLLPIVWFPFVLLTMGVCWFLAATGVFMRDVGHVVGVLTTAMLFLSPIFYPIDALPPVYRSWIQINPLTFVLEQVRGVMIFGRPPHWLGLALYWVASAAVASLGFAWFQKTRRGFADVL